MLSGVGFFGERVHIGVGAGVERCGGGTLASPRPGGTHCPGMMRTMEGEAQELASPTPGSALQARDYCLGGFPLIWEGPISIGKREQKNITAQNERYLHHIWHGGTIK